MYSPQCHGPQLHTRDPAEAQESHGTSLLGNLSLGKIKQVLCWEARIAGLQGGPALGVCTFLPGICPWDQESREAGLDGSAP